MWYWRTFKYQKSLTVGQTEKIELPNAGDLSALLIKFGGTTVSNLKRATGGYWRLRDYVTNIVFKATATREYCNITARQLAAKMYFDTGVMPFDKTHNYSTASVDDWLLLCFGRWLGDEEVGVQLGDCENPELWITHNWTTSEFSGVDVTVVGLMRWRGPVGFPRGYLNVKEYKSWVTVQAETEETKMPTQYPCRRLLLQVDPALDGNYLPLTNIFNPAYNIKLTFRSGADIYYDGPGTPLARAQHWLKGSYVQTACAAGFNADVGFNIGIGYVNGRAGVPGPRSGSPATTYTSIEGNRTDQWQKLEGGGGDDMPELMFHGICPEAVYGFHFDTDPDPRTWLDLGAEKQVQLDVKTRDAAYAAGAVNRIILERLLPHGVGA